MALARVTGGVIVNADSAQLYREIPITSAAPSAADRAAVDHRLYDTRSVTDPCSAADWAALAKTEIAAIHQADKLPILVGGTGLYIRTLLDGIAPIPPIDPAIRSRVRATPVSDNYAELQSLDPESATRLNPADTTRIARALEVVSSTGHPLSYWHRQSTGGIAEEISLRPLILLPPRDWLVARCDHRFAAMLDQGAVEEVAALMAMKLNPQLPAMLAIGVREIAAGGTRQEIVARGEIATRRYAKRQYTWFTNQPPPSWPRFTEPLDSPGAIDRALSLLGV